MADDRLYTELTAEDPLGHVRALIPDIEQLGDPLEPTEKPSYLFDDLTLMRYLLINSGSVRRAAADACDALGTSEMLILKKLSADDLTTDGAALAKEYGAKATRLRAQADKDDNDANDDGGGFFMFGTPRRPIPFDAERGGYPWS